MQPGGRRTYKNLSTETLSSGPPKEPLPLAEPPPGLSSVEPPEEPLAGGRQDYNTKVPDLNCALPPPPP